MAKQRNPNFQVGEVAILQPPHPSARHLWGTETTVIQITWTGEVEDAMGGYRSGWAYLTDVPAPPATALPEDQHENWLWCEYDLKKKHDPGSCFDELMNEIMQPTDMLV